jgi:hypothetical protein
MGRVVTHSRPKGEGIDPGSSGPPSAPKQQKSREGVSMPNRLVDALVVANGAAASPHSSLSLEYWIADQVGR